jgi:hypothetical protein
MLKRGSRTLNSQDYLYVKRGICFPTCVATNLYVKESAHRSCLARLLLYLTSLFTSNNKQKTLTRSFTTYPRAQSPTSRTLLDTLPNNHTTSPTMGDSDNNSSSTESNDPHTPQHAAPHRPTNAARTLTAPSKLPKPRPISAPRFSLSPSHPGTQSSPAVPTTPLDWGEDWSRLSEEIKRRSPAVDMSSRPSAEQDSLFEGEESESASDDDEVLPKVAAIPVEEAARALQSAISFEATFGDSETREGESGDVEQSATSLSATSEDGEQKTVAILQPSTPEHVEGSASDRRRKQAECNDRQVGLHEAVAKVLRFDTNTNCHGPGSGQSVLQDSPIMLGESPASSTRAAKSTKNTYVPLSQTQCSPTTTIKTLAVTPRSAKEKKNADDPSSQIILRGLIRDAHREMMYFTLSHERFSLDDLRQGLGFAFSMLQAAHSKLAILAVLHDDMTDLSEAQLRSWMAQIDHIHPQTRHEPRMFVMFESLSSGEIRVALAEVVQSRLIVEDEVKQMKASLNWRLSELESNEESSRWLAVWVESLQNEHAGTAKGLLGDDEAEWDAIFTAIMAVTVVGFYLCIRG